MINDVTCSDQSVRAKFLSRGVVELSNAELLSIVIGGGTKERSAMDFAESLMAEADNNLLELSKCAFSNLRSVLGVGRAASVVASFELGRRYVSSQMALRDKIDSMRDVESIFKPMLVDLDHEEFWAVYLTSSNKILYKSRISHGGVGGTAVDNKLIIKLALERLSTSIILVHNHPSGDSAPSESDLMLTSKLSDAAKLFDITITDHVIISSDKCYSFRNEGLL